MKRNYIKPDSIPVRVNLLGTVLDDGTAIGGQSHNPVSKDVDPDDVEWSAKKHGFFNNDENDDENSWGNLWQ